MRRMRFAVRGAMLALLAALCVAPAGGAVSLDAQSYYCFDIGGIALSIQTLSTAAAEKDFAVLAYSGNSVSVVRGPSSGSDNVQDILLSAERLLVIDGDRFYLRATNAEVTYAVRPASGGLELVLSPASSVDLVEALTSVMVELQDLGIVGMDLDLDGYRSVARNPFKGPAEPQDLIAKLDYALYGLTVAEDWFAYARQKGIALLGLRLEVVLEKIPGETLPVAFRALVTSESEGLASLVVPVDQLVPLARSAGVGYVRLPYVPVAP